jgi:hypothetical protein
LCDPADDNTLAGAVREGPRAEKEDEMPAWKLLWVATKARRGWNRIPPEQRRKLLKTAGTTARKHGPVIARRIGTVVRDVRKRR